MTWTSHDGGEDCARGVIASKASLAEPRAIIANQGRCLLFTHGFDKRRCRGPGRTEEFGCAGKLMVRSSSLGRTRVGRQAATAGQVPQQGLDPSQKGKKALLGKLLLKESGHRHFSLHGPPKMPVGADQEPLQMFCCHITKCNFLDSLRRTLLDKLTGRKPLYTSINQSIIFI